MSVVFDVKPTSSLISVPAPALRRGVAGHFADPPFREPPVDAVDPLTRYEQAKEAQRIARVQGVCVARASEELDQARAALLPLLEALWPDHS